MRAVANAATAARRVGLLLALLALSGPGRAAAGFSEPAYPSSSSPGRSKAPRNMMSTRTVVAGVGSGLSGLAGRIHRGEFVVNAPANRSSDLVEVTDVGCLDTVIPAPLNWGPLWCAGREAKVYEYVDKVGSTHRLVDIPVQPNVTANMVLWLFSPLFPQYLEYSGKMWFWYHLWHPLDHIMAANKVAPSSGQIGLPGLYTLIHERYRNPPGSSPDTPIFETDAWFHVEDLVSNFLKKRIVISINTAGMQAWTLIVNLKDTPEGLKIDNELILGAAAAGYDRADPSRGAPAEAAVIVNDNIIKPMFATMGGGDFHANVNAITRHVIEEFSMFRFFLPTVWQRFPHLQGMFALSDKLTALIPRFNYGPFMHVNAMNAEGVTELMKPLDRTAVNSLKAFALVASRVPQAAANAAAATANAEHAHAARPYGSVRRAWNSGNATRARNAAVRVVIPSAAGEPKFKLPEDDA